MYAIYYRDVLFKQRYLISIENEIKIFKKSEVYIN